MAALVHHVGTFVSIHLAVTCVAADKAMNCIQITRLVFVCLLIFFVFVEFLLSLVNQIVFVFSGLQQ